MTIFPKNLAEENQQQSEEMLLFEKVKEGSVPLEDLSTGQLIRFLILVRAERKTLESLDKQMQEVLKSDDEFTKAKMEGIEISKRVIPRISLLPEVDLKKIQETYPEICSLTNVLHQDKLTDKVWEYLKAQEGAVEEQITVDAKKLHSVTKAYTTQTLTTSIVITGL